MSDESLAGDRLNQGVSYCCSAQTQKTRLAGDIESEVGFLQSLYQGCNPLAFECGSILMLLGTTVDQN